MRKRLTDRKRTARTSSPGASGWGRRRRRIQCIRTHKASPSEPNKVLLESGGKRRRPDRPGSAPFVTVRDVGRLTIIYHLVYTGADGPSSTTPAPSFSPAPSISSPPMATTASASARRRRCWLAAAGLRRRCSRSAPRGVTKPTLYHHFGSKRGLLERLMEQRSRRCTPRCKKARASARRSRRRADGGRRGDLRLRRRRAHVLPALSHALVRAGPQRSL